MRDPVWLTIVLFLALLLLGAAGCVADSGVSQPEQTIASEDTDDYEVRRVEMVRQQLRDRGIRDEAVLAAMSAVPRHRFVDRDRADFAYGDFPLPIGYGQTISQPYIVAYMSEAAAISQGDRALEIGTGSGYQAAVLAEMAAEVYTIEIIPELGERARQTLNELGYDNVWVQVGDGYNGWPEQAPFDAILLTAAPDRVPPPLIEQLALGGTLVAPVGEEYQEMVVLEKTPTGIVERRTIPVRFVPMTGTSQTD